VLSLFYLVTLPASNFPSLLLILLLQLALISYTRCVGTIRILCGLAPTGNLFRIQTSPPAEVPQFGSAHACRLDYGCQIVSSAPLLWSLGAGRHQLVLLLHWLRQL